MGRDTTAHKRMALKRSREKLAGLRRINVAISKDAFDKLAELMKLHNSTSQARLIEALIMNDSITSEIAESNEGSDDAEVNVKKQNKQVRPGPVLIKDDQLGLF